VQNLAFWSVWGAALFFGAIGCSSSDKPVSDLNDTPAGAGGADANENAGAGGATAAGGAAGGGAAGDGATAAATDDAEYPIPDKLVALTFDDGPDITLTPAILGKLQFYRVPASFFLIGQKVNADTQPVMQRAASLGCEFENHSYGYPSLTGLAQAEIETSVNDTSAAIEQFTSTTPVFFRPPNLAVDALMYQLIDMPFAGGVVGGDFPAEFGGNPTVEAVTDTVLNGVVDGSIILLHDVQPDLDPQPTPTALDTIIPELKRQGYEFVTLRQLFQRRGIDPNGQQDAIWNVVPPAN